MKIELIRDNIHDENMARIGFIDDYELWIYSTEELSTPHFHLISKQEKDFIAIKILEPEYFIHGKYTGKLNSHNKRDLIKFLNEDPEIIVKGYKLKNNYEYICYLWQKETLRNLNYKNAKIPDYILLM